MAGQEVAGGGLSLLFEKLQIDSDDLSANITVMKGEPYVPVVAVLLAVRKRERMIEGRAWDQDVEATERKNAGSQFSRHKNAGDEHAALLNKHIEHLHTSNGQQPLLPLSGICVLLSRIDSPVTKGFRLWTSSVAAPQMLLACAPVTGTNLQGYRLPIKLSTAIRICEKFKANFKAVRDPHCRSCYQTFQL